MMKSKSCSSTQRVSARNLPCERRRVLALCIYSKWRWHLLCQQDGSFIFYNGARWKSRPCAVQEYVSNDLDLGQTFMCHNVVWFVYPSMEGCTGDISRYVIYNYEEGHWSMGSLMQLDSLCVVRRSHIEDQPLAAAMSSSPAIRWERI